jgi:hypothetical protein
MRAIQHAQHAHGQQFTWQECSVMFIRYWTYFDASIQKRNRFHWNGEFALFCGRKPRERDGLSEVLLSMVLGGTTLPEQMVVTLLAWRYASAVIYPGYSPGLEPTQSQTNNPTRSNPLPVGQA